VPALFFTLNLSHTNFIHSHADVSRGGKVIIAACLSVFPYYVWTKSSAIAEGPRDALC